MLAAGKGAVSSHDLLERLSDARRQSDALFALVRGNSIYERPIPERHRIIFYVGHLEAFDWNCQQHITPRFTEEQIQEALAPFERRMEELEQENKKLREAGRAAG